jgi:hypothetical protein
VDLPKILFDAWGFLWGVHGARGRIGHIFFPAKSSFGKENKKTKINKNKNK